MDRRSMVILKNEKKASVPGQREQGTLSQDFNLQSKTMKKLWICVDQQKVVHGKVDEGVGKYNLISILKRSFWLQGSEYWRRANSRHHHGAVFHPHNFIPTWLDICVYMENFRGSCIYLSLNSQECKKAFFYPKSFQRTLLLPCAPLHWCPCLQSASSLG